MEINERVNGKCECDVELEAVDTAVVIRDPYWGNIEGDIHRQEDLQQEFSLYRKKDDQDVIDNEIKEGLANEVTNRETADRELDAKIEAETSRATTKENELSTNLSNEIARAKKAESTLDKKIDDETNRATNAEQKLTTDLADEITRAKQAEVDNATNIQTTNRNLASEVNRATTKENEIVDNLNSEISRAKAAESTNATNIADEITRAKKAEEVLTTNLSTEVSDRKKADTVLQNEIDELNRLIDKHVYGFKREIANSNYLTRITYTDEARGKTPVTVNLTNQTQDLGSWGDFINKVARPVMVTYGGVVDYELDHNDTTKKLDGSPSDIDNLEYKGNAMVEFRNYRYVSRKTVDGFQYVRFANYKVDDTFEDNAFINENRAHSLAFYFSMFDGGLVGDKMRSIAGAEILRSKNASQEMTLAKSNGKGWNTGTWSQLNYIWDLLTLLGKTDGLQETFGRGICGLGYNNGVNPFGWIVGQTKNKGCFFGQSGGANPVRTLWIEDLWGRAFDRYAGMINDNGTFKVKLVPPYPTPSDSAGVYSDYIDTGLVTLANGYVKEANCSELGFLPQVVGGSASTYFCDYFYKNDSGVKYVLVGGGWSDGSFCGRSVNVNPASSYASTSVGSRLSYNA